MPQEPPGEGAVARKANRRRENVVASIDPRRFRDALGQFATGVAIVTTSVDGARLGATISSFNSVSLDPPLVLFSIARSSLGLAQWRAAKAFGICILGEHQTELSNRFARPGSEKWSGIEVHTASNGCPVLSSAVAFFECAPYAIHAGGDHDIFVCEVTAFEVAAGTIAPLIFHAGKYRQLKSADIPALPPDDNMWLHGW
jgi:flavin reductase (DIM6/NTAB) family NADH-FMN oxidoreductase RutF